MKLSDAVKVYAGSVEAAKMMLGSAEAWSASGDLVSCSGGTETIDGDYKIHTFAENGDLICSNGGNVEILVVGGGGAGGSWWGGGGGAGGLLHDEAFAITPQTYEVTVGEGGLAPAYNQNSTSGGDSVFDTLTAKGGGAGGSNNSKSGLNGGSGGGVGGNSGGSPGVGEAGPPRQGYDGGDALGGDQSGGGGGAGGAGANGGSEPAGGIGVEINISGSAVTYAVGGKGAKLSTTGAHGTDNRGNGGGGGYFSGNIGGGGGTGVVIVKYKYQ